MIEDVVTEVVEKRYVELDKTIIRLTPGWWRWMMLKGGIFRKIASVFLKVLIIKER